ncbi:MAG: DUF3795 domain-containing protein [Desulfobacteraceae bacterium]
MTGRKIQASVAPCGLSCEKCFAHVDGEIRRQSRKLKELLGNFQNYAQRFEILLKEPVFRKYTDFKEVLDYFASENCRGCRNEQCKLYKNCGVRPCHQEKQVDFCYQCDDFPCDRTNFDKTLYLAWIKRNEIIRKSGMEKYYQLTKDRPRYP